jgi:phosphoribosylanthranilate isomerase
MKPRLKICGITRYQDALLAASLGAYALGFIFLKKTPRYIKPQHAKEIVAKLPPFVQVVGVFVNEEIKVIRDIASFCHLDLIQLHGDESPSFCEKLGLSSLKAFRIKDERSLKYLAYYKGKVRGFLVDTYKKGKPGGTGESFNWELAIKAKAYSMPIVLAGGLRPDNIKEAIEKVKPYAIDVNSGVESSPGIKDESLLKRLFAVWKDI